MTICLWVYGEARATIFVCLVWLGFFLKPEDDQGALLEKDNCLKVLSWTTPTHVLYRMGEDDKAFIRTMARSASHGHGKV